MTSPPRRFVAVGHHYVLYIAGAMTHIKTAPSGAGGSDETEIEITPEMIEAGVGPLLSFRVDRDDEKRTVREIFRVMARLSRVVRSS